MTLKQYKQLDAWAGKMGSVFTLSDLQIAFKTNNGVVLNRQIKKYQSEGYLEQFIRGFYIWQNPNKQILAQKICPQSYVSLTTALAQYLMIGTTPDKTLYSVKTGPAKIFRSDEFRLVFKGISEDHFFGFVNTEGLLFADPEKALLDTLYYYLKGAKYSFDVYGDINIQKIKKTKIKNYLKNYNNPKFVTFVNRYLHGRL